MTIVEWCTLYGQACRDSDALVSAALAQHPRELRRVFRQLDAGDHSDEHVHELACVAHDAGKFWELRERLLQRDVAPSLRELAVDARAAGLDWHNASRSIERLEHASDIAVERALAGELSIGRTPVLFVNGRRLSGAFSARELEAVIAQELERTRLLVSHGAPRADVYAEIIKPAVWQARENAF